MCNTYHIYLNDKCLFKNLDQHEFDIIWNKLYTSYWKEELYTHVLRKTRKNMYQFLKKVLIDIT